MPPTHAHFNGSVNLADTESVMREIAARVPSALRRVPDGETGDRGNWIYFQLQKFLDHRHQLGDHVGSQWRPSTSAGCGLLTRW